MWWRSNKEPKNKPDDLIEGVKARGGARDGYITAQDILEKSKTLVDIEFRGIKKRREITGHGENTLMGLALSGGGIRSATFSLGVMQALAEKDVLRKMDYLSTVSGGGYIGSSLTWWLHQGPNFGVGRDNFPFGCDRVSDHATDTDEQKRLRHLSQHGKYLTPGKGITLLSGIAIVLRAMLLNLVVWLPVLIVIMMLLVWGSAELQCVLGGHRPSWMPSLLPKELPVWDKTAFIFRNLLRLAILFAAFFALCCVLYSLVTGLKRKLGPKGMDQGGKRARFRSGSYKLRRWFEQGAGLILAVVAVLVVLGSLPIAVGELKGNEAAVAPGAVLVGLASAIWSFFKAGQKYAGRIPLAVQASIGGAVLIYGLLLTAYIVGDWFYVEYVNDTLSQGVFATPYDRISSLASYIASWPVVDVVVEWVNSTLDPFLWWPASLALSVLLFGRFANINHVSMHRFYRDRLMETFLPNEENARDNVTGPARDADSVRLSEVDNAGGSGRGPYHIINTNVLLVDSKRRRWRIRGGDNFILSPLYCGSNATGWRRTESYMLNNMTLPTAMAISGAAANPNTGVGGVGLTRNPIVSIIMALLNLRLGYWADNPRSRPTRFRHPHHFRPGMYEVIGLVGIKGMQEKCAFVQLSDGGHFENLALYELIRRKLRLIIVCDGGADGEFKFADLQTALRRIEEDFGAKVTFPDGQKPAVLVPSSDAGYPMGAKQAERGYIVGDIAYSGGAWGKLILMKTTMVKGASTAVRGYKGKHKDFPDQSTADQFFSEEQFEAYRELGQCIAEQMVKELHLPRFIAAIETATGGPVPTPRPPNIPRQRHSHRMRYLRKFRVRRT